MFDRADDERALDVTALSAWLNISVWKARELGKEPSFPSFKIGRAHRFWPSEVRSYFAQQQKDLWRPPDRSSLRKPGPSGPHESHTNYGDVL